LIEAKLPGSIVNISSQMGHVGAARRTVYCASKHAMEGFTKAMAIELAPHNIRVNSLGPTFLETPMTKPFFENKAFRDEVLSRSNSAASASSTNSLAPSCSSPPTRRR
jgi:NAD(P)-dependent dehydrogenase (short-subunit alcohol dehydrogenase family)